MLYRRDADHMRLIVACVVRLRRDIAVQAIETAGWIAQEARTFRT